MTKEITIDLKKYKKLYTKKTFLYMFFYPFILMSILIVLAKIIYMLGFNEVLIATGAIVASIPLLISPMTIYSFYSGNKNKYKSTKFIFSDESVLFILLKQRNPISGGTYYYHTIHSVSSYTISDDKVVVHGKITRRRVDERYPNNQYKEHIIESFSVPNVFGNINCLEQALKNKKEGVITIGI